MSPLLIRSTISLRKAIVSSIVLNVKQSSRIFSIKASTLPVESDAIDTRNTQLFHDFFCRQNHLVHHLINTKLHCALPKCTLLQNYIVNLDLHVRCQPTKQLFALYGEIKFFVFLWLTTNMQIKVHSVVLYHIHFGSAQHNFVPILGGAQDDFACSL